MKPEWVQITLKRDEKRPPDIELFIPETFAMNVPGGCLIEHCGTPVFVPGVAVVIKEDESCEMVSTAADDLTIVAAP